MILYDKTQYVNFIRKLTMKSKLQITVVLNVHRCVLILNVKKTLNKGHVTVAWIYMIYQQDANKLSQVRLVCIFISTA